MAKSNVRAFLALSVVMLVTVLLVNNISVSEALTGFSCAKDYLAQRFKEVVINSSPLIREYKDAMERSLQRYQEAAESGQLDNKTEKELENFHYKLLTEELRSFKAGIESDSVEGDELEVIANDTSLSKCYDPDALVPDWNPDEASLDEAEENELLTQLDELEREDEMGWSLTPELRENLASRTNDVLQNLIRNEVQQVALAVAAVYSTGGAVGPVLLSFSSIFKAKLVEFFMNIVVDVVSSAMGQKIEIKPAPNEIATRSARLAAAA